MMMNNRWPKSKVAATAILGLVAFVIFDEHSYTYRHRRSRRQKRTLDLDNLETLPKKTIEINAGESSSGSLQERLHNLGLEVSESTAEVEQVQNDLIKQAEAAISEGRVAFRVVPTNGNEDDTLNFNEIFIEVINPRPEHKYSVTIVSSNRYTGTAILKPNLKPHKPHGRRSGNVYSWKPILSGDYEVLVHKIDRSQFNTFNTPTPLIQPPFPFSVSAADSGLAVTRLDDRIQNSPPCQTLNKVDVYSHWDGDWLGPEFQLSESIRTGWSFVPSQEMGCKLETFNTELIQAVPEKKSILILGRSIERGILLSLVDMMLNIDEKRELRHSVINKCWGRMSVTKGNLKVTYQDFRVSELEDPNKPSLIQCHNDKLARDGSSYLGNSTLMYEKIFQQQPQQDWPSVIYLHTAFGAPRGIDFMFDAHVRSFVEKMPSWWQGTLILGDYQLDARRAGFMGNLQYRDYKNSIHSLVKSLNDPRVRWIDGIGISKEMRLYSQQYGEDLSIGESQHFHSLIDGHSPKLLAEYPEPLLIRSNITEMLGQLLLGHALGPKQEYIEHVKRVNAPPNSRLRWCYACPRCLLPFSINPHPQMECHDGPLAETKWNPRESAHCDMTRKNMVIVNGKKVFLPEDATMCPKSCLQRPVTHRRSTESNTIDVRECSIIG